MRRLAIALPLALLLCSPAMAADQSVSATNSNTFTPSTVTVNPNDTVTWTNQGGFHNVVFDDGSFTDPAQPSFSMWTVQRKFPTAGSFKYHCGYHGTSMSGTVVVQAAQQPPAGGQPDTTPPDIDDLKLVPATFCNKKTSKCKRVGTLIRFTLDEDAKISGRVVNRKTGKKAGSVTISASAGANEFDYSGKGLALGRYRLELTPRDAAGNKAAKPTRANFTVATKR
ncbi:MAG TPA: plastocyanin/azurin family copper-binding protein [Thermoleophilaceae bacterium]|jgi:plastocyanin